MNYQLHVDTGMCALYLLIDTLTDKVILFDKYV